MDVETEYCAVCYCLTTEGQLGLGLILLLLGAGFVGAIAGGSILQGPEHDARPSLSKAAILTAAAVAMTGIATMLLDASRVTMGHALAHGTPPAWSEGE